MGKIRVVVLRSKEGFFAQCLEYDIGAQGQTEKEAMERLHLAMNAERADLAVKGKTLASIGPAPEELQALFGVTAISSMEIERLMA